MKRDLSTATVTRDVYDNALSEITTLRTRIAELERERDEVNRYAVIVSAGHWDEVIAERAAAIARAEKAEQERDGLALLVTKLDACLARVSEALGHAPGGLDSFDMADKIRAMTADRDAWKQRATILEDGNAEWQSKCERIERELEVFREWSVKADQAETDAHMAGRAVEREYMRPSIERDVVEQIATYFNQVQILADNNGNDDVRWPTHAAERIRAGAWRTKETP